MEHLFYVNIFFRISTEFLSYLCNIRFNNIIESILLVPKWYFQITFSEQNNFVYTSEHTFIWDQNRFKFIKF
jgi:hypothetical protein